MKNSKKPKLRRRIQLMRKIQKKAVDMELREHKSSFLVYIVLRALVVLTMVLQIFNKNYENVFLCLLTLILLTMPSVIQVNFKIELPTALEITILLFIFAAEILGEIGAYYIKFSFWDTALHTINGFLMAAIGFAMVDILNQNKKTAMNLSPLYVALGAFCFSMTIGVIWEFFEFGMDRFFALDMQKDTILHTINSVMLDATNSNIPINVSGINDVVVNGKSLGLGGYLDVGLFDTMKDLFVNFIGAVVFSIAGYFYIKNRGKGKVAKRFIPSLKNENTDFLEQVIEEEKK